MGGAACNTGADGGSTGWRRSDAAAAIEGTYHVAAAHHKRRTRFPSSFADGISSPLHLIFPGARGTTAHEDLLDQELIWLDADRVGHGEVEAQPVAGDLLASTSVFEVSLSEAVVPVGQDSIRGRDAKGPFPLLGQLVRMLLGGDSQEDAVIGLEGGGEVSALRSRSWRSESCWRRVEWYARFQATRMRAM